LTTTNSKSVEPRESDIAIIGCAGRFPSCDNVAEMWRCLLEGRSGVKSIQPKPNSSLPSDPNYVAKSATVEQADCFDAAFFGILPKHAQEMDPQHRLFMEICWNALEDAGYRPDTTEGKVAVFAGCHMNTYIFLRLAQDAVLRESLADSFPGGNLNAEILNDKDYLATRIAYHLNLKGPAVAVQTACSTSLVAIAQACQSLEAGDCTMALAGGSCITFPQDQGYLHTEDSILSPDGICRTFDAEAKGTIFADGVGAVVLKRLADALRDGDSVYAVIKGWGVNNDGGGKAGYTAPSVRGQTEAILRAHQKAGITADTISYVEAHGTGTLVGDPIEIAALSDAFRRTTDKKQYCAIGSLKSNFGHLDVAAGVTAAIKTSLALNYRKLPPNLNFSKPNPRIDFANSPFFVQEQVADWVSPQIDGVTIPRRAGVSSFGVGGTNAHLVMEECDLQVAAKSGPDQSQNELLCLSAASAESLQQMCQDMERHLEKNSGLNLSDASYTLLAGRKPLPYRFSAVGGSASQWLEQLRAAGPFYQLAASPKKVFLFPGQGSQHVGMAAELYRGDERFKRHLDAAAEALMPHTLVDLRPLAFGTGEKLERIDETAYAQPAIFMVSYALARWLQELGVEPDYVIGHSVGEFAAAVVAGIMSLADGARLIAARGRVMQALPTGSMLAVNAELSELAAVLPDGITVAALNAPTLNVVSGPSEQIALLERQIESGEFGDQWSSRLLRTSHAFHSAMMDPAIKPFAEIVGECQLKPPEGCVMISTVTAREMTENEAISAEYWAHQIRQPVLFFEAISQLLQKESKLVFCEVGPSQALTGLVRQQELKSQSQFIFPICPHAKDKISDQRFAVAALGKLWESGVELQAARFFSDSLPRRRLHLPVYRFERRRHWFEVSGGAITDDDGLADNEQAVDPVPSPASQSTGDQPNRGVASVVSGATGITGDREADFGLDLIKRQIEIMKKQLQLLTHHDSTT
jgi:acyl transferase domain-containing protein